MVLSIEGASNSVDEVVFSFYTDEEVKKNSRVKITNANLLDTIGVPAPGGLYDPALGPSEEKLPCKTCGQLYHLCPGHFGRIELVSPVYNPLMISLLRNILQRTCFTCCHFRANKELVEKCSSQLELIMKGDIIGAKRLDSINKDESMYQSDDDDKSQSCSSEQQGESWTSLQFEEAISIVQKFLKKSSKKCQQCGSNNPKISQPTFGWFRTDGLSAADARANVINSDDTILASETITDDRDTTYEEDINSAGTKKSDAKRHKLSCKLAEQNRLSGALLPSQVKMTLELLWKNEARLCSYINDIQGQGYGKKAGHSMFFLENIFVPPIKFRPPTKGGDMVSEHAHTVLLSKILQSNIRLGDAHLNKKDPSMVLARWMELQQSVNVLFNSSTSGQRDASNGIIQLLEKKEGLFRQKMMGKRVNFACRSVISPDPYLAVNEIGIPPYFALRLTYPERVTPWNVMKLRNAILNGPEIHPGATHYGDKSSIVKLPPKGKLLALTSRKLPSSRGVIMHNGKICDQEFEGKIVYRHLKDGDVVLVNRQPTLHKPSIMAHIVRVLKGEKTVRMHYANCSTYNADFDGDEINVHFPQDEISRAEAYNIVNANNQYVKPTSGDPIRALIQDHIVSAALLTKKDTFLSCEAFNQLLYSSGVSMPMVGSFYAKPGQKVFTSTSESEMFLFPPAIWKPEPLWTGKQVISALLYYVTRGSPPFTVEKNAKIPANFFKTRNGNTKGRTTEKSSKMKVEPDEDKLLIYRNDLVCGVVDKAQFGDYGIVHTVQELYGSNIAGNLLSAFSRLFTNFLQMHGFTCGVDDLLITERKDGERMNQLKSCEEIGDIVHREFVGVMEGDNIDPTTLQLNIEKKIRSNGDAAGSVIQFRYGEDGVDVHQTSFITKFEALSTNNELVYSNCCRELDRSSPYISKLPDALEGKAENFICNFSSKKRNRSSLKRSDFLKLMEHKYVSSLAQPGEAVGVLASQSVGEPATQMTLNTFHLAGRGEMNVTLGIPRLQEIVMNASENILTPFMTCPLRPGKSMEDAICLSDKLKRITVADIIESMEVSVVPVVVCNGQIYRVYKLVMKLYKPKHYPKYTDITVEDWEDTLRVLFVRELEDAIENHVALLSKIGGIKDFKTEKSTTNSSDDVDGNETDTAKKGRSNDDDDDDGGADDTEGDEDLGFEAQKRKQQVTDEVDYEDDPEDETRDNELSEVSDGDYGGSDNEDDKNIKLDARGSQGLEDLAEPDGDVSPPEKIDRKSKPKSSGEKEKKKSGPIRKKYDRSIFVEAKGMHFEIHFQFTHEPHILLAQIAQKTANKVCIQKYGKVGQCKAVTCKESGVIYYGEDHRTREDIPAAELEKIAALQTSGVNFQTFWDLEDHLDLRYIYSNDVHAMLKTYGVEAGRETIIREVKNVFKSYGISVDIRHLMLIADFMTFAGKYRPMSRSGGIAFSTSPFLKMCFETASKFIVEASSHGLVDTLDTPSSRICLGLPVKMGTGCHDLLQKLEI
ncbi:DNA-directed RNA polymerase I subunit 1 [Arachis ipaensis]|uniref:DNA-directed RNA polymerase I subunit 1 n=1 Tax=Arachis ipaensis TaxID=130454 RepID=UPI0007AF45F2|nr:DNA-directed RNA polymerase I subunit 1 [Arachis ipaensis]